VRRGQSPETIGRKGLAKKSGLGTAYLRTAVPRAWQFRKWKVQQHVKVEER